MLGIKVIHLINAYLKLVNDRRACGLIIQGDNPQQILQPYFINQQTRVAPPTPTELPFNVIVLDGNYVDGQAFFEDLDRKCSGVKIEERTDKKLYSAKDMANNITFSSKKQPVVLVLPNIAILPPIALDFLNKLLAITRAPTAEVPPIHIRVVMGLAEQAPYSHQIGLILKEHTNIGVFAEGTDRISVKTENIIDLTFTSEITPEQQIVLFVVALCSAFTPISTAILERIFEQTINYSLPPRSVKMTASLFKQNYKTLLDSKLISQEGSKDAPTVRLRSPHLQESILNYAHSFLEQNDALRELILLTVNDSTSKAEQAPSAASSSKISFSEQSSAVTSLGSTQPFNYQAIKDQLSLTERIVLFTISALIKEHNATKPALENIFNKSVSFSTFGETKGDFTITVEDFIQAYAGLLKRQLISQKQNTIELLSLKFQESIVDDASTFVDGNVWLKMLINETPKASVSDADLSDDEMSADDEIPVLQEIRSTESERVEFRFPDKTDAPIPPLTSSDLLTSLTRFAHPEEVIAHESDVSRLNAQIETYEKQGEYENVNRATKILLDYYQGQSSPDLKIIFKLWEKRLKHFSGSLKDEENVKTDISVFIQSPLFLSIPTFHKLNFYTLVLEMISLTSLRLLDEKLAVTIFDSAQTLSDKELILSPLMRELSDKTADPARKLKQQQQVLFGESSRNIANTLASEITTLKQDYEIMTDPSKSRTIPRSYRELLSLHLFNSEFNRYFKDNGIDDPKIYEEFFLLHLMSHPKIKLNKVPSSPEKVAVFKDFVYGYRENLLLIIMQAKFYRNFIYNCYIAQDIIQCFSLVQCMLKFLIKNKVYGPDLLFYATYALLLERSAFSRSDKDTRSLFNVLQEKRKSFPNDLLIQLLCLVVYPRFEQPGEAYFSELLSLADKAIKQEGPATYEEDNAALLEANEKEAKRKKGKGKAEDDDDDEIFSLAPVPTAKTQPPKKAVATEDTYAYTTAVYTRLKFLDLATPRLKERHAKKALAINKIIRLYLSTYPGKLISALHVLSTIRQDQAMMGVSESPLIPEMILDELLRKYTKDELITVAEQFLTPDECKTYKDPKKPFSGYSKVKLILAASGNKLGLADFYLNEMQACIATGTTESIYRGVQAGKVFLKRDLIVGLKGRLSEASGIMAICVLIALHYKSRRVIVEEDDAILKDFLSHHLVGLKTFVNKVVLGAKIIPTSNSARLRDVTKHTPGAQYIPVFGNLALDALEGKNEEIQRKVNDIMDKVSGDPDSVSNLGELVIGLMSILRGVPAAENQYQPGIFALAQKSQAPALIQRLLAKNPDADPYAREVTLTKRKIDDKSADLSIYDDTIQDAVHICQHSPEVMSSDVGLVPPIITRLITSLLRTIEPTLLGAQSNPVEMTLLWKDEADKWFLLSYDIQGDKPKLRVKPISSSDERSFPCAFLKSIPNYSRTEIDNRGQLGIDPYFNPFKDAVINTFTAISLGAGFYLYFCNNPVFTQVKRKKENDKNDKLMKSLGAASSSHTPARVLGQNPDEPPYELEDVSLKDVPSIYFAALQKTLDLFITYHRAGRYLSESSRGLPGGAHSIVRQLQNPVDLSPMNIAAFLNAFARADLLEMDALEESLRALRALDKNYTLDIVLPRRQIAVNQLNTFLSKHKIKELDKDQREILLQNLHDLFAYKAITSYYDVIGMISSKIMDKISKLITILNDEDIRAGLNLCLFIDQYHFHQKMSAAPLIAINVGIFGQLDSESPLYKAADKGHFLECIEFHRLFEYTRWLSSQPAMTQRTGECIQLLISQFIDDNAPKSINIEGSLKQSILETPAGNVAGLIKLLESTDTHLIAATVKYGYASAEGLRKTNSSLDVKK